MKNHENLNKYLDILEENYTSSSLDYSLFWERLEDVVNKYQLEVTKEEQMFNKLKKFSNNK